MRSAAQIEAWMPKLASMQWLSAYCLTEPGAGSDAAALQASARKDGDTYILNGTKQFISGAGSAEFYFIFARTGGDGAGGVSAFAVLKDTRASASARWRKRWAGTRNRRAR